MSGRMEIDHLRQTCDACPSQWEGQLTDGRAIYVRYRWGTLIVAVSKEPSTNVFDAIKGNRVVDMQYGDNMDGTMDTATMMNLAGLTIKAEAPNA